MTSEMKTAKVYVGIETKTVPVYCAIHNLHFNQNSTSEINIMPFSVAFSEIFIILMGHAIKTWTLCVTLQNKKYILMSNFYNELSILFTKNPVGRGEQPLEAKRLLGTRLMKRISLIMYTRTPKYRKQELIK